MNLRNTILLLTISFFVLTACHQQDDEKSKKLELRTQLSNLHNRLKKSQILDLEKGDSMVKMYQEFVNLYPDDSLAVEYLFKSAEIQMGMNKNRECIETLSLIQNNYPKSAVIPMLLQFKAFVYDDKFQAYNKARACMDELIEDYPENEMILNAKAYREMIGKDPNEMFQKADSIHAQSN